MPNFFHFVPLIITFGTYPIIHIQSTNTIKVGTAITKMQTYYILLYERRVQKMYICQWAVL